MIFSRTFHECLCIAHNVFAVSIVKSAVYVRKRYVFTFSLFPSIRIRVGSISQFSCVRLFVLIPTSRHVELRASCTAHGVGKCYIVQWSVASLKHLFLLHRQSRMRHTRFTYSIYSSECMGSYAFLFISLRATTHKSEQNDALFVYTRNGWQEERFSSHTSWLTPLTAYK